MSMSAAQARTALKEVMQYAEEGIHYNDERELRLLTERVSSYFDVRVNIRANIAANGEESLRARMLLARFTEAHDLRVDNTADSSAYSLRKVVGWMCTKGMSDEGDVDMTKQQKGGTYVPTDFKQMLMTQAKKWKMVQSVDDDVVCGTPLWDGMFMAALHRLSIATSEVDRNRSREEGWKLVAREANVALHAADGHASAGEEIVRTASIVRSPINTMSTEEVDEEDVFNEWTMTEQQWERGFEDSSLPIDFEYEIEETRVINNEKDARAPDNEVEVSGSDVSSDEEGEEYDAYLDMEAGGGQASKGWAHAILRLTRVFSNPNLLLRVVLKEATPEGALMEKDGHEWGSHGGNRSRGMVVEAGKSAERVDEEHLFPFTWTSRRHAIAITKRDVLRLGAKQWLNDDVIDMYLQSVYEEHFPAQANATLHVCTTFWHPAVIANQKVYVSKARWQERIKSRPAKLHRLSNELRTTVVVLILVNHKNHWKLLLLLNVGRFLAVTEDNDGQKRPVAIVMDSFQQSGRQEWKALRTFLWYEYLNEADKAGVLTTETMNTSWVTCKDLLGSNIVYAECSQQTNTSDCGVYVCCLAAQLMRKLANVANGTNITAKYITEVVSAMEVKERTVERFRHSMVHRFAQCAAMTIGYNTGAACDIENVFRDLIDGTRSGSS
ncbi:hypothetical protein CBR_g39121 [Chara braunii]|uniref:Ubiquitin-like protease family profile domain-containing protein n=1 Tax=Chara braunii TaxID=69332 RepID=A0A388LR95_CHABU|nr:hypothetical protein CBR_g39121 [Chara braunii]|eukprot:GBG84743.1 hypothetical protein CBR_g39121 [Chara braunii]